MAKEEINIGQIGTQKTKPELVAEKAVLDKRVLSLDAAIAKCQNKPQEVFGERRRSMSKYSKACSSGMQAVVDGKKRLWDLYPDLMTEIEADKARKVKRRAMEEKALIDVEIAKIDAVKPVEKPGIIGGKV